MRADRGRFLLLPALALGVTLAACVSLDANRLDLPPERIDAMVAELRETARRSTVVRHGRLLLVTRGPEAGSLRPSVPAAAVRHLEGYLEPLAAEIRSHARHRLRDRPVRTGDAESARRPLRLAPFRVKIDLESSRARAFADGCGDRPTVWISLPLLQGLLQGAISFAVDRSLYADAADLREFFARLDRAEDPPAADPVDRFYNDNAGYGLASFERWMRTLQPTELVAITRRAEREYLKALVFVIAHEASHLWLDDCRVVPADSELRADLYGVISAQEVYLYRCYPDRKTLLRADTLAGILDDARLTAPPPESRSFLAGLERLQKQQLIGRSGADLLTSVYEDTRVNDGDDTHRSIAERVGTSKQLADEVTEAVVDQWLNRRLARWLLGLHWDTELAFGTQVKNGLLCPHIVARESDDW